MATRNLKLHIWLTSEVYILFLIDRAIDREINKDRERKRWIF